MTMINEFDCIFQRERLVLFSESIKWIYSMICFWRKYTNWIFSCDKFTFFVLYIYSIQIIGNRRRIFVLEYWTCWLVGDFVSIRLWIYGDSKSGCAQCRILLSRRWHQRCRWAIENLEKIFRFFETFSIAGIDNLAERADFALWPSLKMIPSDREFNSTFSTTGFRISTDSWVNPDKSYSRKLQIVVVFCPEPLVFLQWPPPPWKWSHRIENKILHLTWPDLKSAQIHGRIRTRITLKNFWFRWYFGRNSSFLFNDFVWKRRHRIENKILHLTRPDLESAQIHGHIQTWITLENF